jgi:hypothetical protein
MAIPDLARMNGAFIESQTLQTAVLLGIFDGVTVGDVTATAAPGRFEIAVRQANRYQGLHLMR